MSHLNSGDEKKEQIHVTRKMAKLQEANLQIQNLLRDEQVWNYYYVKHGRVIDRFYKEDFKLPVDHWNLRHTIVKSTGPWQREQHEPALPCQDILEDLRTELLLKFGDDKHVLDITI